MSKEIRNPNDEKDFADRHSPAFRQISHPAALPIQRLLKDCTVRRTRRSGPGGQHRNKVETAVIIEHRPTRVSAEASERRSQEENRQVALFRLRLGLAVQVRYSIESPYTPSELWLGRCRGGRLTVNLRHDDFPALLAEALDVLANCANEVAAAAGVLGCTTSQLVKFLQLEPRAIVALNRDRERKGFHKLK
jgi:hypothetical protein